MEKLDVETNKKKEIVVYNESKFVEVGNKFANDIYLPKNYDVIGSMKALHLMCISSQSGDLTKLCTPVSIEMGIREVLQKGLNPLKKQCYPVKMGDKLVIMQSYQGAQRAVYTENKNVIEGSMFSQVILKNDKFIDKIMPDGRRVLVSHTQAPFGERSEEEIGVYSVVQIRIGGKIVPDMELMTMKEVQASWAMSRSSGEVHKKFKREMMKKTCIARHCKRLYGWTDESNDIDNNENKEDQPTYDIDADENVIEVNENDIAKVEETNDVPEGATVVDRVEIKEDTNNKDGSYKIDYKTYIDNKEKYEKLDWIEEEKMVLVRDKK